MGAAFYELKKMGVEPEKGIQHDQYTVVYETPGYIYVFRKHKGKVKAYKYWEE
jgi:hypothetical protein